MEIADKDLLLHRSHVLVEKVHPLTLKSDLIHVNVTCWHIFITPSQSFILQYHSS